MDAPISSHRPRRYRTLAIAAFSVAALGAAAPAMAVEGVGDRVFNDVNNNGIFDAGESGVPGVTVTIELDNGNNANPIDPITGRREGSPDCLADALPPYPGRTIVTNADGAYYFAGVGQGNYIVEIAPSNFAVGGPLAGFTSSTGSVLTTGPYEPGIAESNNVADDNKDHGTVASDRIRVCNVNIVQNGEPVGEAPTPGFVVDIPDNSQNTTIDFGVFKPVGGGGIVPGGPPPRPVGPGGGSGTPGGGTVKAAWQIGDRVWSDVDKDGIQDPAESGIAGVEVKLYDAAGTAVGTTTTDTRGAYRLDGLFPGTFRIGFGKLPLGAKASPNGKGSNRGADSDLIPSVGRTAPIAVANGDLRTDVDAGFIVQPGVGGLVWRDSNSDGQQGVDEKGVRGITVTLTTTSGRQVARTRTNGKGKFFFLNVKPGNYLVAVSGLPKGLSFTGRNKGSDLTDSDVRANGRTARVRVAAGQQVLTVGAGLRK